MLKLKDVPEGYNLSNPKRSKLGESKIDYTDYIEVVLKFFDTDKPYMMVEIVDEDEWLSGNTFISRLRTAIDICEMKNVIRAGYVSGEGKWHYCLYRRDMGY